MQVQKYGRMSSITLSLIFGLWAVSYMNWLLLVHLFKLKICRDSLRKLSKEFTQGFLKLFQKIWTTWSRCCCRLIQIGDLAVMSCYLCLWFCQKQRNYAHKYILNKWRNQKSHLKRLITCWKPFTSQSIIIPTIKTRKHQLTKPNLTNSFDISNNHYQNQTTTSKSQTP